MAGSEAIRMEAHMLVLTRGHDESLLIYPSPDISDSMTVKELFRDGPIRVNVRKGSGGVRIGVEAPPDLSIIREELYQASHNQQEGTIAPEVHPHETAASP
jgi:sRNA-binding carbon storage regulator CsrA